MDRLEDRVNPAPALILSNNSLIPFDTNFPAQTAGTAVAVTGLGAGENLVGIDVRPQTGGLFGLTSDGAGGVRLYSISRQSGAATPLTAAPVRFDDGAGNPVNITGTSFGFDFNPTVDRIRVVTDTGLNFRMNPNTGLLVDGDTTKAGVNPDANLNATGVTGATASAYTNSSPNVTVTTLYALDSATDKLFVQNPPNNGVLTTPLAITLGGAALDVSAANGFDIPSSVAVATSNAAATGKGFAALTVGGKTGIYAIDLATGAATLAGNFAAATAAVQGLALLPAAGPGVTGGTPLIALAGTNLLRFNSTDPTAVTKAAVTGLTAGETLVGIDIRPATGQLFGVGINPTTDTGTVYTIDPQGGAATVVGTAGSVAFVNAAGTAIDLPDPATVGYGVDFNPTVDRIRVVTGSGLNFRLNPINGAAVDGDAANAGTQPDGNLNATGVTGATATAYTNSFNPVSGKGVTTQYTLDSATDKLFIQNPPNNGTLTNPLAITLGGAALDFSAANGFDIPASVTVGTSNAAVTSGTGFAALTVGGTTSLFAINLTTGAATKVGAISDGATAVSGLTAGDVAQPAAGSGLVGASGGFAAGADAGKAATVNVYNADQSVRFTVTPFGDTFTGGVRVATADFNNDGVADVAVGTGPGIATSVRVIDGATQKDLFTINPFEAAFTGGVFVAAGDITGDGRPDLIITPDQGGGPRVRIFSGNGFGQVDDFLGIEDTNFRGGARAAVGDVNGDGRGDLVVAAGFGGGPRIAVFSGTGIGTGSATRPKLFGDFFVFENSLRNGAFVAAGDVNGDGKADLVAGGGPGGGPRVRVLSGADLLGATSTQTEVANFFAGDTNNRGGIRVAVKDLDGDARGDLVVGSGTGAGSRVTGYLGSTITAAGTPAEAFAFDAFSGFNGGVFVG